MREDGISNLQLGIAAIVAIVLIVVFVFDIDGQKEDPQFTYLRLGSNRIALSRGSYELWWQTLAHPDTIPEPADFDFAVASETCGHLEVDAPSDMRGETGKDAGYTIWSVGTFELERDCDQLNIQVRVIGRSPPSGELVLSPK